MKYKHKNTGIIGELKENGWVHFERKSEKYISVESIHSSFVINSCDWEEVKNNNPLNLEIGKTYRFKYKNQSEDYYYVIATIIQFTEEGFPWANMINNRDLNFNGIINSDWQLVNPVLTTEDGVDLYTGDKVYCVTKSRFDKYSFTIGIKFFEKQLYKFFSTEKAAQNYIENYKPVLSFNDIWNLRGKIGKEEEVVIVSKRELQNLVKSKL
jgi:hypothetical protein